MALVVHCQEGGVGFPRSRTTPPHPLRGEPGNKPMAGTNKSNLSKQGGRKGRNPTVPENPCCRLDTSHIQNSPLYPERNCLTMYWWRCTAGSRQQGRTNKFGGQKTKFLSENQSKCRKSHETRSHTFLTARKDKRQKL